LRSSVAENSRSRAVPLSLQLALVLLPLSLQLALVLLPLSLQLALVLLPLTFKDQLEAATDEAGSACRHQRVNHIVLRPHSVPLPTALV
jgi:hypothetical protein